MAWVSQLLETITTYEWWQIILIILAIGVIPVVWRIDPNKMLESLRGYRERKRHEKAINNCFHAWMNYPLSNLSKCGACLAWIDYSQLMLHKELGCYFIITTGEHHGVIVKPGSAPRIGSPHNKRTKK